MRAYSLIRRVLIPRPQVEVFSFFQRPENLSRITPPTVGFRILTPLPLAMKSGAVIDYTIKVFGIRQFWTTLITDYDPPHRFADVQLKGPYRLWHHTHIFESTSEGTLMTDSVRYLLPFGWLGHLMHEAVVKRQLRDIFDYRTEVIGDLFGEIKEVASTMERTELRGAIAGTDQ